MSVWPNKALLSLQNSLNNMLKIFFLLFIIYAKVALYKNSLNWTFQAVWAVVFCCYYLLPIISVNKLSSWAPPPQEMMIFCQVVYIVAILSVDVALGKVTVSNFLSVRIGSLPSPVTYAISASRLEYKDLMNLRWVWQRHQVSQDLL